MRNDLKPTETVDRHSLSTVEGGSIFLYYLTIYHLTVIIFLWPLKGGINYYISI